MSLKEIVQQALRDGHLDPSLQAEVMALCNPDTVLSAEDSYYLDQLMGAILTGEVAGLYCADGDAIAEPKATIAELAFL